MKVLTVVGARPQFIKAAPVSKVLRAAGHQEFVIHTGQHYDPQMSQIFFDELGDIHQSTNLSIGSGSHAWQTGQMLIKLEEFMLAEKPDWVLVYGDTNSTLAGALAACKLRLPIAHIEAGLRSYNREMPEEHNRILTDHCADTLFCPTQTAVDNLAREGITRRVHRVGDTMYDAVLQFVEVAGRRSSILGDLNLKPKTYALATVHRAYNTDDPATLRDILVSLQALGEPVIFPMHPRTRHKIAEYDHSSVLDGGSVRMIAPLGYLDMLMLQQHANLLLTDSGGMQKEAYFLKVPCVTIRPETEWVETVESGWNTIGGTSPETILSAVHRVRTQKRTHGDWFGDGTAAKKICQIIAGER